MAMNRSDSFERIFNPRTVAIVGASEDPRKMGGWCMSSFIDGRYPGKVFPINPKSREIRGIKTYASLNEVPEQIDLAIVVIDLKIESKLCQNWGYLIASKFVEYRLVELAA